MSGQIFEGKTVEEALQKAASELGVEVAALEHEPAGEKSVDFWGLGEPAVRLRAWVRAEQEAASPPAPEVPEETGEGETEVPEAVQPGQEPAVAEEGGADSDPDTGNDTETSSFFAPAPVPSLAPEPEPELEPATGMARGGESSAESSEASGEGEAETGEPGEPALESAAAGGAPATENLEEATVALLNSIFGAMGFDCSAEARVDGDALLVAISGDDNQYLLDGRGRGLSALELILNHAFRHRAGAEHKKIHVDAGDFRARREDEIRDLAYQVAHQAKETGTEQETQPLNPYERRIVHLTLADDEQVTTRSLGSGFMKPVCIIPSSRGRC